MEYNEAEKYCLLCRCLDSRSVPTYIFRSLADFFNSKPIPMTVDQACCLVKSGRVINAWMHGNIIEAKNYSTGSAVKTPYTIPVGTQSKDNGVILFRDSRAANLIIMLDMSGDASILTFKASRQLVESNAVNVINMPTKQNTRHILSLKYLPLI